MNEKRMTQGRTGMPTIRIRRTRRLPPKSVIVVKEGDTVAAVDAVATSKLQGRLHPVFAAQYLGVAFSDLPSCMLVKEGDAIREGMPIAAARTWFGLSKREVVAPCDGTIKSVSALTGQIMAAEAETTLTLRAYLPGKVVRATASDAVEIEATVSFVQGVFGVGGERFGRLVEVDSWPKTAADMGDFDEDAIWFSRKPLCFASLAALEERGVCAAIAGAVPGTDLMRFAGKTLNPACTSEWKRRLCVIVTEGFGVLPMADGTATLLRRIDRKPVSVNGATQVRAGVIRPEIIGPPVGDEDAAVGTRERSKRDSDLPNPNANGFPTERSVSKGDRVRIVRGKYFGETAKIISTPAELRTIGSGARTLVYEVELATEERFVVPRANVDPI